MNTVLDMPAILNMISRTELIVNVINASSKNLPFQRTLGISAMFDCLKKRYPVAINVKMKKRSIMNVNALTREAKSAGP